MKTPPASFAKGVAAMLCLFSFVLTSPVSAQVVPGDTFNIAIVGLNQSNQGAFLVSPLTATFGSTQMFAGAGLGNQTVTVASSQTFSAGFTTATITISVPMNFVPAGTLINGMVVTSIQMHMGGFNAGMNTLDFANALSAATFSGSAIFSGGAIALTPTTTLSNGNRSLAAAEGVNSGASDISPFAVRSFSFSARFETPSGVPETGATYLLLGSSIVALLFMRRLVRTTRS